jgi:hypothetical protein
LCLCVVWLCKYCVSYACITVTIPHGRVTTRVCLRQSMCLEAKRCACVKGRTLQSTHFIRICCQPVCFFHLGGVTLE